MVAGVVQLTPIDSVSSRWAASRSAPLIPTWNTSPHSRAGTPRPLRSVIGLPSGERLGVTGRGGGRAGRGKEFVPPVLAGGDLVDRLLAVDPKASVPELDRVELRRVDVEGRHLVVGVLAEAVHQRDVVLVAPVEREPHVVEGRRLDLEGGQ